MTTPLVPPEWIEQPPAPLASYGLFNVAIGPTSDIDEHGFGGGVQWITDWCSDARLYPAPCDSTPPTKTFDAMDAPTTGTPFKVYATIACGTQTFTPEQMEQRARARLAADEQRTVESMLWGADAGDPPGILQTLSSTTLADQATVVAGISVLEQQLAGCYAHPGILHIRPRTAAYLADRHQLWKDGTIWRTQRGNAVSIGDGYSGLGPADEAPTATTEWMFITGRVFIWRSTDVLVPPVRETINKVTNQYNVLAERDYVMAVECCIVAVEVTLA